MKTNKCDAGSGYELCRWDEAEESACHLGNKPCSGDSHWMKVPEGGFARPQDIPYHRFYYRRRKRKGGEG